VKATDDKQCNTHTRRCKNALAAFSILKVTHYKIVSNALVFHPVLTALIAVTHPALLTLILKIRLLETYLDDLDPSGQWAFHAVGALLKAVP
jgi:hypothetical protein